MLAQSSLHNVAQLVPSQRILLEYFQMNRWILRRCWTRPTYCITSTKIFPRMLSFVQSSLRSLAGPPSSSLQKGSESKDFFHAKSHRFIPGSAICYRPFCCEEHLASILILDLSWICFSYVLAQSHQPRVYYEVMTYTIILIASCHTQSGGRLTGEIASDENRSLAWLLDDLPGQGNASTPPKSALMCALQARFLHWRPKLSFCHPHPTFSPAHPSSCTSRFSLVEAVEAVKASTTARNALQQPLILLHDPICLQFADPRERYLSIPQHATSKGTASQRGPWALRASERGSGRNISCYCRFSYLAFPTTSQAVSQTNAVSTVDRSFQIPSSEDLARSH